MEKDHNLKLKDDSNQLALKDILIKASEEISDGASSSNENKKSETSKDAPQKEEICRSKTPTPGRSSPEPSCAICLEQLQNKSFTDSCFHMFCFTCLVEWSKVKPECPLCKQRFSSIVHNVRSFKDYDQYFINKSRLSGNLLSLVADRRFRYSSSMTTERLLERNFNSGYSGGIENEIASHRMRYAPHSVHPVRMYASPQTVRRAPCSFRRRIYEHNLWVRPSDSSQIRCITPAFFRRNVACTHRLLPWLNRELLVVMPNNESQISFVIELIMSLIAKYEITSQEFYTHIEPYTSSYTAHFIHEFYNFAISPYEGLNNYDLHAQYSTDVPDSLAVRSVSSPDSDVIPLGTNQPNQKSTSSESRRKKQHHSKKKYSKDYKKLRKIILKRNSENNCWETIVPSVSSYLCGTSISGSPGQMPGPSTSRDNPFLDFHMEPINQELEELNEVECLEGKDDEECQVVEVLKPKRERTPEIVDLSSDDDLTSSSVNFREDAFMPVYNDVISSPEVRQNNIDSDNDDIIIVSETKTDSNPTDKPIDYSLKTTTVKEVDVYSENKDVSSENKDVSLENKDVSLENKDAKPSTSSNSSKKTEQKLSDQPRSSVIQLSVPNLSNDETASSSKSPLVRPKKRRAALLDDSSTESCSEGTQVTEINSRIKKLKLRSVIAHFSYDPSDEHNDSTHHSSSHKKHKDRRKKKKKHKHKRHIYSSDSN